MHHKTTPLLPSNTNIYYPVLGIPPEDAFGPDWAGSSIVDNSYTTDWDNEQIPVRFLLHPKWNPTPNDINNAMLMAIGLHLGKPQLWQEDLDTHGFYDIEQVLITVSIPVLYQAGIILISELFYPIHVWLNSGDNCSNGVYAEE